MGWTVHDLTLQTGSPPAVFDLAGFVFQGQKHVFYNGFTSAGAEDGRIHELYGTGTGWNRNDLTAAADENPRQQPALRRRTPTTPKVRSMFSIPALLKGLISTFTSSIGTTTVGFMQT